MNVFIRAMVKIFSFGERWNLPFHSAVASTILYYTLLYGWDKCRTLIGWLPVRKKSSCPLRKFILPAQEIHLARSWKHCTNKIFKETKAYYAVLWRRRTFPEWVLLSWRNKWSKCYVSRWKQRRTKQQVGKCCKHCFYNILMASFCMERLFVKKFTLYFRRLNFFLWSIHRRPNLVIVLILFLGFYYSVDKRTYLLKFVLKMGNYKK